ncbi:hypothetical protein J8V17_22935, partial [Photorhabdus bodei]|uniref:hypothetical protein n=1 Tax=Photorhabdus bodei TaxID=2029681 RepID=UPI001E640597
IVIPKFPVHPSIIIILNDLLFWWKFSIPSITDAQNIVWSVNSNGKRCIFIMKMVFLSKITNSLKG